MSAPDTRPDKRPLSILAGPYGHPFHAIAVTIPIGAWVASFVFDIIGLAAEDPTPYAIASRTLIGIGLVGSLAAIFFGILDYLRIPDRTVASSTATIHMGINMLVCGAYAFQFFLRTTTDEIPMTGLIFSGVSLLALGASGWLGGKLAYRYGVRVADEATQARGYRQPPPR